MPLRTREPIVKRGLLFAAVALFTLCSVHIALCVRYLIEVSFAHRPSDSNLHNQWRRISRVLFNHGTLPRILMVILSFFRKSLLPQNQFSKSRTDVACWIHVAAICLVAVVNLIGDSIIVRLFF